MTNFTLIKYRGQKHDNMSLIQCFQLNLMVVKIAINLCLYSNDVFLQVSEKYCK